MNGISIMLLNTVKTCLYNFQLSTMDREEKNSAILACSESPAVAAAVVNEGAVRYFGKEYLEALSSGVHPVSVSYRGRNV